MNILLDTQIALWFHMKSKALPKETMTLIENSTVFYSAASTWEIAIKHQIRPLVMPMSEEDFITFSNKAGMKELPVLSRHTLALKTLRRESSAPEHKDPFDRLLIAQAKTDGMVLLTADEKMSNYHEKCVVYVKKV